jgi:hypothetical protein
VSCLAWNLPSNVVQYLTQNVQDFGKVVVSNMQCSHIIDERVLYLVYSRTNRLDFLEQNCKEPELRAMTTIQYQ